MGKMKQLRIKNCLECPFSEIEKVENGGELGENLLCMQHDKFDTVICKIHNIWCGQTIPKWCPLSDINDNKEIYQKGYNHGYTNGKIEEQRRQRETQSNMIENLVCNNCGWIGVHSQLVRTMIGLSKEKRKPFLYCPNCGADDYREIKC